MNNLHFEFQWPRENLFIDCFIHEIFNFRYHWHNDLYELTIVLNGTMEMCIGTSSIILNENDVALISPGTGHASSALQPNTRALVIHISTAAFKTFLSKDEMYLFPECISTEKTNNSFRFKSLKYYAANILTGAYSGNKIDHLRIKGSAQMLLFTLINSFNPTIVKKPFIEENEQRTDLMKSMISYLEKHYSEKISLEDLAEYSMYNRTYISTLFKSTIGIGFHTYLTRIRFQHALFELATTQDTLTDIALRNGFSDLKSFNANFKEVLHRSPQEYRNEIIGRDKASSLDQRAYISSDDIIVQNKLNYYLEFK